MASTSEHGLSSWHLRPALFADVPEDLWQDWRWQQRGRIRDLETLGRCVDLTDAERAAFDGAARQFRVAVTPHYLALMSREDPGCPIRLQAIPGVGELTRADFELDDPLGEEAHMPVPGLTHRYADRVLLYTTHNCPVYCRHCTRKRKVAEPTSAASRQQIDDALQYIARNDAVRDVVISGGDPLTLSDERLDDLLARLRAIPHVEVVRLGTRNPVTLPQRVTPGLVDVVRRHGPVYVHTHFNHPKELGPDARRALADLLGAGCVLGNQMVLLAGVNDDPETVLQLNRGLLAVGCRPYYMLQCDMAAGIAHFRTPLERGLEIVAHLRGRIGGMGIPDFVVDLPGGGGKIELVPEYLQSRTPVDGGVRLVFRNSAGRLFEFHDVAP